MRILIVEKDPVGRRLLEQMMRMEGYEVFILDRNKQAINLINEIRPDIVLMNVFNPLQSGTEPLEQIKIRCNEELDPVIYVTCMGRCDGMDFMAYMSDSNPSLFDRLPEKLKMHIVDNSTSVHRSEAAQALGRRGQRLQPGENFFHGRTGVLLLDEGNAMPVATCFPDYIPEIQPD